MGDSAASGTAQVAFLGVIVGGLILLSAPVWWQVTWLVFAVLIQWRWRAPTS